MEDIKETKTKKASTPKKKVATTKKKSSPRSSTKKSDISEKREEKLNATQRFPIIDDRTQELILFEEHNKENEEVEESKAVISEEEEPIIPVIDEEEEEITLDNEDDYEEVEENNNREEIIDRDELDAHAKVDFRYETEVNDESFKDDETIEDEYTLEENVHDIEEEHVQREEHKVNLESNVLSREEALRESVKDKHEITERIPEIQNMTKHKKSLLDVFYFGAKQRIVVYVILIIMFIVSSLAFLRKAYQFSDGESVNYRENYNLNYRVNLKPNDFFPSSSLGMNMTYVANLIDSIDINYDYKFDIDKDSDIKFTYYTYAILDITDSNGNSFFTKNYQLSEPEEVILNKASKTDITKKVNIDYDYYNSLANHFRSTYGVSTESKLKVYLKIMKTNQDNSITLNFVESEPFALEIPLSEKNVNINMNYKAVNENNEVLSRPAYSMIDKESLIISVCFLVLTFCTIVYMVRFIIKIQVKKTEYDKVIAKILREYDRLIVTTSSKPDLHSERLVKVKEFNELLDVRDTVQLPIMYYEVTKHQKCYFYINQNNILYLLTIKAIDLENK